MFLKVLQVIGKDSRSDEHGIHNLRGRGEFSNFVGQMGGGGSARLLFLSIDTKHACQQLSVFP